MLVLLDRGDAQAYVGVGEAWRGDAGLANFPGFLVVYALQLFWGCPSQRTYPQHAFICILFFRDYSPFRATQDELLAPFDAGECGAEIGISIAIQNDREVPQRRRRISKKIRPLLYGRLMSFTLTWRRPLRVACSARQHGNTPATAPLARFPE